MGLDDSNDLMFQTEVGEASHDSDGAYVVVRNFIASAADGNISISEQKRISGTSSDIASNADRQMIFVAERANSEGLVLGYVMTMQSGDLVPSKVDDFPGLAAVYLANDIIFRLFKRSNAVAMNIDMSADEEVPYINDGQISSTVDEENKTLRSLSAKVIPNSFIRQMKISIEGNYRILDNVKAIVAYKSNAFSHGAQKSTQQSHRWIRAIKKV